MTGRDLIIYILDNKLEDEEVVKDGTFIGFASAEEIAAESGVGIATVKAWYKLGILNGIELGDDIFFYKYQRRREN